MELNQSTIKHIEELLEAARLKVYKAYDEGYGFLQEAYDLSKQYNYQSGIAWATMRLGSYALSRGDRLDAVDYYNKALELMHAIQDFKGVARCHFSIATIYALMDHFDVALSHYLQALNLKDYDKGYYTKLLNNISNTYKNLGQYAEALKIANQTLHYMNEQDEKNVYMVLTNIGEIYLEMKDYKSALKYSEMALKEMDQLDEPHYQAFANMTIAGAYKGMNYLEEALIVYNRAFKLLEAAHDYQNSSKINREIAEIYLQKKEYEYAFKHCQTAMTLAIKHTSKLDEAKAYFLYAKMYESLGDFKKAFESYRSGSEIERSTRSAAVEERYKALQVEIDVNQEGSPAEEDVLLNLQYTLGELRSTYLNLNKAEKSKLTDAFVEAVVDTIDLRDTTTSGHSKRIAKYSLEMMHRIDKNQTHYKDTFFTDNQRKEMYYAALLHDIGKLAVEEKILLKKRRLTEDRMEAIHYRFLYMKTCLERKLEKEGHTSEEAKIYAEMDEYLTFIQSLIYAGHVDNAAISKLQMIHSLEVRDCNEHVIKLIDPYELKHLSVAKGNLTQNEWQKMREHAVMTRHFLTEIPWLNDLENVPVLASSHHEKLDGSGYPEGLAGDEITLQMRILAIVDIFEALTASDRPYKRAMSIEEALKILHMEVDAGKLDKKLVEFFEQEKICYLCEAELKHLK